MKKTLIYLIIIFTTLSGLLFFQYSPCSKPIIYTLGTIDSRFNTTNEQVLQDLSEASGIWGTYENNNLFEYDSNATLKVNLVFDERQGLRNRLDDLDEGLKSKKQSLDPEIAKFNMLSDEFEAKLKNFNDKVNYWNSQGGAPREEYEKLVQEEEELRKQSNELNQVAAKLNQSARQYNTQALQYNNTLNTLESAFSLKPEQGRFDPELMEIDIYYITDENEFIHTLAHELGHARGVDHVENSDAVMFPYSSKIVSLSGDDKVVLNQVCKKRSYLEISVNRWRIVLNFLMDKAQEIWKIWS